MVFLGDRTNDTDSTTFPGRLMATGYFRTYIKKPGGEVITNPWLIRIG